MSGATAAIAFMGILSGGGSGGGDVTPAPLNWTNANGDILAFTNNQTLSGINAKISLKVSWTGSGTVLVQQNGTIGPIANGAAFQAVNTDLIAFGVQNGAGGTVTGTVTITNQSDSNTVLDTFTYTVTRVFI